MAKKKVRPTFKVKTAILKLLEQHLKVDEHDPSLADYIEGWSDEKIASAMGNGINADHVSRIRREMYGKSRPTRSNPTARLDELEARLARVETAVGLRAPERG